MEIRVLTDRASDFTQEEIDSLNLTVLDMPVIIDGEVSNQMSDREFWKALLSGHVSKTSQPSPSDFKKAFKEAKEGGYALICVLISSNLSSTYETAMAIKAQVGYQHIYIIDSLCASAAEKLVVLRAIDLVAKGKTPLEIESELHLFRHKVKLYACIDSLKYLYRGGRISKTTANIGTVLNIKPIITFDSEGHVATLGNAMGSTRAIIKMTKMLDDMNINRDIPMIPVYSYEDDNLQLFMNKLKTRDLTTDAPSVAIGPTVGTHIGPGGFGIAIVLN